MTPRGVKPGAAPQQPTIAVSFRLPPETKARLDHLCNETNKSQAVIIGAALNMVDEQALAAYLGAKKRGGGK